jgi:hypothetical protein
LLSQNVDTHVPPPTALHLLTHPVKALSHAPSSAVLPVAPFSFRQNSIHTMLFSIPATPDFPAQAGDLPDGNHTGQFEYSKQGFELPAADCSMASMGYAMPAPTAVSNSSMSSRPAPLHMPCVLDIDDHDAQPPSPDGNFSHHDRDLLAKSSVACSDGFGVASACLRSTTNPSITSGDLSASRATASQRLGRGAWGLVDMHHHTALNRLGAEKRVPLSSCHGAVASAELSFAERAIAVAEQRPELGVFEHIVEIFAASLDSDCGDIVVTMECLQVGSLSHVVRALPPTSSFTPLAFRAGGDWLAVDLRSNPVSPEQSGRVPAAVPLQPSAQTSLLTLCPALPPAGQAVNADDSSPNVPSQRSLSRSYLPSGDVPLDVPVVASLTRDVLVGLRTMHTHLNALHRDIKPGNILLTEDGRAKLADFGLAVVLRQGEVSTTEPTGSYAYMSPERLRGEAHGAKADVWSVGVTVLELACDRHPFLAHDKPLTHDQRFWILATQLGVAPAVEADVTGNPDVLPCVHKAIRRSGLRDDFHFSDFVQRALHPEAAWRASVDELLAHPWLDGVDSA